VFNVVPLEVRQLTGISFPCSGTHVPEDAIDGTPGKD